MRVLSAVALVTAVIHVSSMRAPQDRLAGAAGEHRATHATSTNFLAKGLFFVYQRGIGPTKGSRCAMTPSCSEFGRLSYQQHGILMGTLLAFDRLHRCGHDLKYYHLKATQFGSAHADDPPTAD